MFLLHECHTSLLKSEFIPTWTFVSIHFLYSFKQREKQDSDKRLGSEASLSLGSASVIY